MTRKASPAVPAVNFIQNGDFEQALAHWTAGDEAEPVTHAGSAMVRMLPSTKDASLTQFLNVPGSGRYHLTFRLMRGASPMQPSHGRITVDGTTAEKFQVEGSDPAVDRTLSFIITLPDGTTGFELGIHQVRSSGATYWYLDDVVLDHAPEGDNLIQNGDFDQALEHWTASAETALVTHAGSAMVRMLPSSTDASLAQRVNVPGSGRYHLTFRFMRGASPMQPSHGRITVDGKTAEKFQVEGSDPAVDRILSFIISLPDGTTGFELGIHQVRSSGATYWYLDDVALRAM